MTLIDAPAYDPRRDNLIRNLLIGSAVFIFLAIVLGMSGYVAGHGARITRNLVGNYITSLEMQGFSVTVCRLSETLAELWDAPVETPGLRWGR